MKRIYGSTWGVVIWLSFWCMLAVNCRKQPADPAGGTQETKTPEVQYSSGDIPDNFPGDVPVYRNITASKSIRGGVNLLHLQSQDDRKQIIDYYRKELNAARWQLTEESAGDLDEIFARKQQRSVTVSVRDKGAAGRVIDITY